jgi:hypothetical protein
VNHKDHLFSERTAVGMEPFVGKVKYSFFNPCHSFDIMSWEDTINCTAIVVILSAIGGA